VYAAPYAVFYCSKSCPKIIDLKSIGLMVIGLENGVALRDFFFHDIHRTYPVEPFYHLSRPNGREHSTAVKADKNEVLIAYDTFFTEFLYVPTIAATPTTATFISLAPLRY
jgi:hypothetical protein